MYQAGACQAGETGGRITAILDFEFTSVDTRAMDLASALYFCMRIWENPAPLDNARAFCRGYGQRARVTTEEIAALPWLTRLRNIASTIWWLGRQLAAGQVHDLEERISDMQRWVHWLQDNESRLLEIAHDECGPTGS